MTGKPQLRPVVLLILDGFGIAPPSRGNAISIASMPHIESYIQHYPVMALQAAGEAVGLPWGEMGNSEVGHLNLGAGKIMYQELPRINKSIADGDFFKNEFLAKAAQHVNKRGSTLHFVGLVSSGGVHSSIEHLFALLEFAKQKKVKQVAVHCILDGRDTPPKSAITFIQKLQDKIKQVGLGEIATLIGRWYAMDRDNRWDRVQKGYNLFVKAEGERQNADPLKAIEASYTEGNLDEEFKPTVITKNGAPVATISEKDAVIFFNFRPDRSRQLTKAFTLPGFDKFNRVYLKDLEFVTLTEYEKDLPVDIAYPPEKVEMPLARVISKSKLKQIHIAETEKYAHVTYFLNGGQEEEFLGEEHALVPSPRVSSYAEKPEMSVAQVVEKTVHAIESQKFDFIAVNFANPDMVGHTGNLKATVKALEFTDDAVSKVVDATLAVGGAIFITADHGNCEQMVNLQTGAMDKEHTTNPVPFFAIGAPWKDHQYLVTPGLTSDLSLLQPVGILSDVPVTILETLGLNKPEDMTGRNLLE
ncbi:MAG: 2,3-bisphosphoglycerate-independent phosphoglycerate mutase [Patescibacteria group bacterium]|jgi:2,3-bisphosphoglycerate-independent phosphoglycerate mutase